MTITTRGKAPLDWLNFFLADVRDGLGPYLAIYLLTVQKWDEASIGIVMSIAGIAAIAAQTPAGALIDNTKAKRALIIAAAVIVTLCCVVLPFMPGFIPVAITQAISGAAGSVFQPAIAAITLGMMGPKAFTKRTGRNEAFNHAGNAVAAILAGGLAYIFGPIVVFYLLAVMAAASVFATWAVPADAIDHDVARGLHEDGDGKGQSPSGFAALMTCRPLLIFAICIVLFHFANAAMLPLVGQKLALINKELGTTLMSACIVAAQLVMIPIAMLVGAKADVWGRKPTPPWGFIVLPLRGILFTLSDNPFWLVGVQALDGVGAGIFGALFPVVVNDLTKGTGRFNVSQGAITTALGIGAALSTTVAGTIVVKAGYSAAFLTLAAIAAAGLALFWIAMPETGKSAGIRKNLQRRSVMTGGVMMLPIDTASAIWGISALATGGVIVRPWQLPEYVWAVAGAALLLILGLVTPAGALDAVKRGTDVYLFLIGMMLLAELARTEGLFDWLATQAARYARGSAQRLFVLIYLVGVLVTVVLSNDATAVVLTPAVYAATRAAKAEPLPYLLICAFVANAASFVLPISNPANLVVFGSKMPSLTAWLWQFGLPSLAAIAATFVVLWATQRRFLSARLSTDVSPAPLSGHGRRIAWSIGLTAAVLMTVSFFDWPLGLPTFLAGAATALYVLIRKRESPVGVLKGISWSVLPLVAGLFVLVQALETTGLIERIAEILRAAASQSVPGTTWLSGVTVAVATNLMNNLPAGLLTGSVAEIADLPTPIRSALLIGVDLGPNLSVTGSLATILWLIAIRREGGDIGAWAFLKVGILVMPPALALALTALFASGLGSGVP